VPGLMTSDVTYVPFAHACASGESVALIVTLVVFTACADAPQGINAVITRNAICLMVTCGRLRGCWRESNSGGAGGGRRGAGGAGERCLRGCASARRENASRRRRC